MSGKLLAPHKPENAGIKRSPQEALDELNLDHTQAEQVKAEGNKMLHSGELRLHQHCEGETISIAFSSTEYVQWA